MFLGEYQHNIDAKGRLAIPAKFRAKLEGGAVLVRGIEACIYGYTEEMWEVKTKEFAAMQMPIKQRRLLERRFYGTAEECELDSQGRIVVPQNFRRYADLAGEIIVLGVRDRFELWSRAGWDAYQEEMSQEDISDIDLPF
jgi:MraZ protein